MRHFTALPPLSLYVHLPWCLKKCPYCDFNSHAVRDDGIPEQAYVAALLADLEQEMPDIWGRTLSSVFLGGGTPSLFSARALDDLFCGIRALTGLAPDVEVTIEANPGTFEQERFRDYRALGINRLSIGVQSFDDRALTALGRVHDGSEARRAIEMARNAGFDDVNLDLMFALPGQTLREARADLELAIALEPTHLSYYELTLEPNTWFARYPPAVPADALKARMHDQGIDALTAAGFDRYEVSAFAQPGRQCQHNLNYWQFGDYAGIGAGAHAKLSFADRGEIVRRWKVRQPAAYLRSAYSSERIGDEAPVSEADTALEFMMNALRLTRGFDRRLFQQHTGLMLARWQPLVQQCFDDGLMEQEGTVLRASERGFALLNDLLERFLPGQAPRSYPVVELLQK